jgi:hypothetical protein
MHDLYVSGEYLHKNPTWHIEDSSWKAMQIARMLERNPIKPMTVCEVGCGAGEILSQLQRRLDPRCVLWGYDISPQAFELSKTRANDRLHFKLGDIREEKDVSFDLMLLIDLLEHLEDYLGFLKEIKSKSQYKILHIPLEISVQAVLRAHPLSRSRASLGHVHYFTKEVALDALRDTGYMALDYFYTAGSVDLRATTIKEFLAKIPRKLFFMAHRDFAVRLWGGFSLMVLAT